MKIGLHISGYLQFWIELFYGIYLSQNIIHKLMSLK